MAARNTARRWFVRGRVQGVGFRYFTQEAAVDLGLTGYTRNLDDGRVEVYAVGPEKKLDELAGRLHRGPWAADVRGVEELEAAIERYSSFRLGY
jgi:acylphosphatase